MTELTREIYTAWKQQADTMLVFRKIDQRIKEIQEGMGTGGTLTHSSATETLANTAREVGRIEGLSEIFDLDI